MLPVVFISYSEENYRPDVFGFGGVWFEVSMKQQLHLVENTEGIFRQSRKLKKDGKPPDIHFALKVSLENFHRILNRVDLKGIPFLPQPFSEEFRQLYVLDPDNHLIEITALEFKI